MCPWERFSYYKSLFRLVLCYKRIGPSCCTLFTFVTCCSLQITLSQNYLLPIYSVLAKNTLLKTACHFLLLLVGFNTLTYRKDYDISPILVGHQGCMLMFTSLEGSFVTVREVDVTTKAHEHREGSPHSPFETTPRTHFSTTSGRP